MPRKYLSGALLYTTDEDVIEFGTATLIMSPGGKGWYKKELRAISRRYMQKENIPIARLYFTMLPSVKDEFETIRLKAKNNVAT